MLLLCLILVFLSVFSFIVGLMPSTWASSAKVKLRSFGLEPQQVGPGKPKQSPLGQVTRRIAVIMKPLASKTLRQRIGKDLMLGQVRISVEEFLLFKLISIVLLFMVGVRVTDPEMFTFVVCMSLAGGYMVPEYWLKGKIKNIKEEILRELPDAVDLLGLCVNAGLDFMLALKWVVEKSHPSVLMKEFNNLMQEINVGKPRRDALRDLARKYQMPDLSTFARTLIQADKMGTSVTEALNILSVDMREARFRRGEAMALKAPLKMLVPLLFFIFPVVGILVAGPIFLEFFQNNAVEQLSGGVTGN